jgi:B-box zinc finger
MNCAIHNDTPAVAYCRTCGKALCENCKRDVMGAIYCEPCIAARLQGGAPAAQPAMPVAVVQGAPSPGLAALLGMIPGVGAMYNSQFVKAFIHVIIFAGLIMAQEYGGPAEALFGLLTAFFWFYMVFDAYQTAKARLLGRPLPDFLGLERLFGIHEIHQVSPTPASPVTTPIQETTPSPVPSLQNIPTGAIVLIGLGVFFLLVNLGLFRFHHILPLLLIAFGLWLAYKRSLGRA